MMKLKSIKTYTQKYAGREHQFIQSSFSPVAFFFLTCLNVVLFQNANGQAPTITSFSPANGPVGTIITITGTNFNTTLTNNLVFFGPIQSPVSVASTTSLTVTVPAGTTYAPITVLNTGTGLLAYSMSNFMATFTPNKASITEEDFESTVSFNTGSVPFSLAAGDLNGDGNTDLAVANSLSNTVSVLMGTGTSNFSPKVDYTTGTQPRSVAIGNFNGDGKPDLVVANENGNSVSVFINTGTGTFGAKVDYPTGMAPYGVTTGDFNGDGKTDLYVANYNSNTLSILAGTGTGSFSAKVDYSTGARPFNVATGELNGDGIPDLVVTNSISNTVSIFIGTSTGIFAAKVDYATGIRPYRLAIGDLNGDGKADLAVANRNEEFISVLTGTGAGTFEPKVDYPSGTNAGGPRSITIGDFNGDGHPDLAVGQVMINPSSVGLLGIYTNTGTGSFGAVTLYTTSSDPNGIVTGDFNRDGKSDVALAGATSASVSIRINDPVFRPTISSFTPANGSIGTTVTINGTNFSPIPSDNTVFFGATKANITVATTTQLTVTVPTGATYKPITVLVNELQAYSSKPFVVTFAGGSAIDTNSFAPKVDFVTGTSPRSVCIGDLDGDGKADMAIASVFSNAISIYRNISTTGSITFATKIDFTTGTGSNPYCVAIGDLDGDGKQDIAVANYNNSKLSVFRNTSSGTGVVSFATKVDFTTGTFPRFISIGDLDADGKSDLVVSNAGSNTISIFRNISSGAGTISFAAKTDLTGTTGGMSVLINDLDNDGKPDLAIANWVNPGAVTTYRNISLVAGSIDFAPKVDFAVNHNFLWSLAAGDLNNDGLAELVTPVGTRVKLLSNNSTAGTISLNTIINLEGRPSSQFVSIDDLNGDGKVDLAVSNDTKGGVSAIENTSSGAGSISFGIDTDFTTGTYPVSNAIGDIDGDGRADLVVPNHDANTVSVLRNIVGATSSPTISSFTPASGPVGTTVTITGTHFSTTPANNTVKFNNTTAVVTASTATSITVTVPANATTGKITVTVAGNTATSATDFTVTTGPVISITTQPASSSVCNGASATFTTAASGTTNMAYQWQFATALAGTYSDISNGNGYVNTTTPSLSVNTTGNSGAGFYRCRISGDNATTVFTNGAQLTITTCNGNQPPAIQPTTIEAPVNRKVTIGLASLLSDPDDNLDLSTLKIIVQPLSGAIASIDGQSNLILDYSGISFSGIEMLTIEVCDLSGSCAQKELDIEVAGDVVIYNAISPNGDQKNDFLFLQYIEMLDETKNNHVTIFNRWGSIVWEGDNYDNTSIVFDGKSKSGNELPSGNYFYRIEFASNYKTRSGFLALKR